MRSAKEFFDFCDEVIERKGTTRAELARKVGMTPAAWNMSIKRDSFFKVELMCRIAEELRVPLTELLGLKETKRLPADIEKMVDKLMEISVEDRELVAATVDVYYRRATEKKEASGSSID